jgi:hypothetical protein
VAIKLDLLRSEEEPGNEFCEYSNKLSCFIKGREFFKYMSDRQVLKEQSQIAMYRHTLVFHVLNTAKVKSIFSLNCHTSFELGFLNRSRPLLSDM